MQMNDWYGFYLDFEKCNYELDFLFGIVLVPTCCRAQIESGTSRCLIHFIQGFIDIYSQNLWYLEIYLLNLWCYSFSRLLNLKSLPLFRIKKEYSI